MRSAPRRPSAGRSDGIARRMRTSAMTRSYALRRADTRQRDRTDGSDRKFVGHEHVPPSEVRGEQVIELARFWGALGLAVRGKAVGGVRRRLEHVQHAG